jgi:uncharacterized protein (UPF0261 family)
VKSIVIIATLDTKGEEAGLLADLILRRGHKPLVVDVGSRAGARQTGDIPSEAVARAAGMDIDSVRAMRERHKVLEMMTRGATVILVDLCNGQEVEGVIGIGGASSTAIAAGVMGELPLSLPKLIVSTAASMPGSHRFFGASEITIMQSVIDTGGLNSLLEARIARAAAAICGMVEADAVSVARKQSRPRVAMCSYGYTDATASYVFSAIQEKYEPVRFHASGVPEVAMEKLIAEGAFCGVVDLVPSSVTNGFMGGSRTSWAQRLEVAGRLGIPQVVAPGGVNTYSRTGCTAESLASELATRRHYYVDAQRVTVWLHQEELRQVAAIYADKLNKAVGPTKLLIPLRGWIEIETEASPFFDRAANDAFVEEIKGRLKPEIEVREIDANIAEPVFAQAVLLAFREVMAADDRLVPKKSRNRGEADVLRIHAQ